MANANLLKKLYLFKDLSDSEIDIIKNATAIEKHVAGDEIFSQGDMAKALYIVQVGSVKIHQVSESGDSIEIARLGAGSHFGEMSFLDGENRSAAATCLENSEIMVVDYDKLSAIMVEKPGIAVHFYRQFAVFLCGRLRTTTKDLSFSRSKVLSHF